MHKAIDTKTHWTISVSNIEPGCYVVRNREAHVATIRPADGDWHVEFHGGYDDLNFKWRGGKRRDQRDMALHMCMGYVRGVERMMALS